MLFDKKTDETSIALGNWPLLEPRSFLKRYVWVMQVTGRVTRYG
jgi:hypothetical protein